MMSAVSTYPSHVSDLRRKNTWYTACDGKWSNPTTWMSNGRRIHNFPQTGDDVVISHTIMVDAVIYSNYVYSINNLNIEGKLLLNAGGGVTFNVMGNLVADAGTIDFTGGGVSFNLYGPVTNFGTLVAGTTSTIGFCASCTQYISKPVVGDFYNLLIINTNYVAGGAIITKYLNYDMTNTGTVSVYSVSLELGNQNVTFNIAGFINNGGAITPALSRKGIGSTIFTGLCNAISYMDLGTNTAEFRNGVSAGFGPGGTINAGLVYLSTNDQSLKGYLLTTSTTPVLIGSGITVTADEAPNTFNTLILGSTINGVDSTSTFYCNAASVVQLSGRATDPMITGVWNMQGSIYYSFTSGSYIIKKPLYVDFNIYDSNGCTYTLGTDVTVNGNAGFYGSNVDLLGYNLTVNGTLGFQSFQLKRTGIGNTVIKGLLTYNSGTILSFGMNVLEIQAGMKTNSASDINNWTLGTLLLTTTNQSFAMGGFGNSIIINGNIEVSAGLALINLTNLTINGVLNGGSSQSSFDNQLLLIYQNSQRPMQTGIFQCNTVTNTFTYDLAGDQDIAPGTYRNLTLGGSGAKRLLENVSVVNTYLLSAPATLDNNGFSLTNP